MTNSSEAAALTAHIPESTLTIHQDLGNPGRILFSLDLHIESNPQDSVIHNCDLVALTLFNLARVSAPAFNETFMKVRECVAAINKAQEEGASPETLAAIRDQYGIAFRAE